jgi:hypothetical protein
VLRAYLNYPNAKVSVHGDLACGHIEQAHKLEQRSISLRHGTLGAELARFVGGEHQFASHSGANDMWLDVEFGDPEFEEAMVRHIHRLLAARYKPFQNCVVERHC